MSIKNFLYHHKTVFFALLLLDLTMVLLHLVLGQTHWFFHLDFEANLPTTYQSGKLIGFGIFFLYLSFFTPLSKQIKSFTIPLALAILALGLDELFQIHENIWRVFELFPWLHPTRVVESSLNYGYRSSLWILYYLPIIFIFVFWCGYWLRYFQSKIKPNFWIILVSCSALFAVLYTELLSSTGFYTESTYFFLVTVEETAEMLFASTFILVGLKAFNSQITHTHSHLKPKKTS